VVLILVSVRIFLEQWLARLLVQVIIVVPVVNADLLRQNAKFSGVGLIILVSMMSTILILNVFQFPGQPE